MEDTKPSAATVDCHTYGVRLPISLVQEIDAYVRAENARFSGARFSRNSVVQAALHAFLRSKAGQP